jgi:hypothetical protein
VGASDAWAQTSCTVWQRKKKCIRFCSFL